MGDDDKPTKIPTSIRLNPLGRLYFTLDFELSLDESFPDKDQFDRLIRMHLLAEQRRDSLFRNMLVLDAVALLLFFGRDLVIPGLGINISTLPAAREVVIFLASVTFQFAAWAFVNWLGYTAMIEMIGVKRSKTGVDAEFFVASDKFLDFAVKIFRPKMNLRGSEVLTIQRGYRLVSAVVTNLLLASVIAFLFLHLVVVFVSARETVAIYGLGILQFAYLVFLFTANFSAALIIAALSMNFTFLTDPPHEQESA